VIARAAGYNIRWLLRWIVFLCAWILQATIRSTSGQQSIRITTLA
jgi:hypothetical protein